MLTAKSYLEQVRKNQEIIESCKLDLQQMNAVARSVSSPDYSSPRVQKCHNNDSMYTAYERIEERKRVLLSRVARALDYRLTVTDEILDLPDQVYTQILYRRYIQLQKWEQIAIEMNHTIRHVQRLNGEALAQFYEMYKGKHDFERIGD